MKTKFNFISDDWKRIKNHSRTTVGKAFTDNEATDKFKIAMLIAEHSPIRLLEFDWTWENIKYWVSTEWSRHKFEKFIKSQRNDRQSAYDRNKAPQDAPVNFDGYANMQNLIDAWRKRLCFQTTNEARELAEDFKDKLSETNPYEAIVLVPNCVYRGGCPEINKCKNYNMFMVWCDLHGYSMQDMADIQKRYVAYDQYYKERKKA